jgi:hypothetical protein
MPDSVRPCALTRPAAGRRPDTERHLPLRARGAAWRVRADYDNSKNSMPRRFPPPWSVDEADPTLDRRCFTGRDAERQAFARLLQPSEQWGQRRFHSKE